MILRIALFTFLLKHIGSVKFDFKHFKLLDEDLILQFMEPTGPWVILIDRLCPMYYLLLRETEHAFFLYR